MLGSPVGDLGHTFRRLNGSFFSGLPAMVVAALSHVYPDLDRVINEHVTDDGKAMLPRIEKMTTAHAVIRLVRKDMGNLVDQPLEQILDTPEVQHVFDSIKLGTAAPTPPVLIVQAVHDRDRLRRGHRRADRHLRARRRRRHLPPRHVQRAPAAASAVGADDAALAARPVRRTAAVRAHRADQVADDAEPVDLPRACSGSG